MFDYIFKIPTRINRWLVFIVREHVFCIGDAADNCILGSVYLLIDV